MSDSPALDPAALLAQQNWVERLARGLVRDSSLAADLAQEAWLAGSGRGPTEPAERRGFLAGVVRNLRRNQARGERRRGAREAATARPEALPSAAELVERAELARLLVENVLALDEHERTAILLRYFEDLSAEEIARRAGLPAGTVRARLSRGLERLRARLEARIERRDLLAGLVLLGRGPTEGATSATTTAAALSALGGWLAMKGLALAAGGAVLLTLATGLWFAQRSPDARGESARGTASKPGSGLAAAPPPAPLVTPEDSSARRDPTTLPGSHEVPPVPEPRPRVRLLAEVVDATGLGLAGVEVLVNDALLGTSGARGAVALELPYDDRHEGLVVLTFTHPEYARVILTLGLRATGEVHAGRIELEPGAFLRGRVVDEHGRPVAGAALLAGGLEDPRSDPEHLRRLGPYGDGRSVHGTSAEDGSFELAQVPHGAGRLWAGHAGHSWASLRFELGYAGKEGLEIVLPRLDPTDTIAGVVVDPEGRPVPGARLHTWFMAANYGSSSELTADGAGRFELRLEQRVAHDLTAADPENRWSEVYRDAVEPGTHDLVLAFEPPRWVEVEVRAAGAPLADFELKLDGCDGVRCRRMTVATEPGNAPPYAGGRARLRLPTAPFTLAAHAFAHASARQGPFVPGEAPALLHFSLDPLPGVRGLVRTKDGQPVAGAEVGLYALVGANVELERNGFRLDTEGWTDTRTTTDAQGRFVLYPPPPGDGRHRGRASVLRVLAEGHAPTELAARVFEPSAGLELEIELVTGGTIEGIASYPEELDPAGYVVAFHRGDGDVKSVRLGHDGRFRLEQLAPGAFEVRVLDAEMAGNRSSSSSTFHDEGAPPAPERPYLVLEGETTYITLDLAECAPARLEGELQLAGGAAGWSAALLTELASLEEVAASTALEVSGRFSLAVPSAGSFELLLSGPEGPHGRLELRERLTLAPGTQDWSLALPTARLAASGALGRGPRERFYRYEWRGELAGRALTARVRLVPDANGAFELACVPAGPGRIARNDPPEGAGDFAAWETLVEFTLAPGERASLTLP